MKKLSATLIAGVIGIAGAGTARADERATLEQLRETALGIVEGLVEQGVLTRAKADEIVRKALERAKAVAAQPPVVAQPPATAEGTNVVRVPLVPEAVRTEMREQIKQEVLTFAKAERWGDPAALPSWLDRVQLEGDLRFRYQVDKLDDSNASPLEFAGAAIDTGTTRIASYTTVASNGLPSANTREDRERLRLRARLGVLARVNEHWGVGLRLGTGSTGSGPVSTSQTLGQNGSTYGVVIDRAYLRYEPGQWLSASAGRIPNPFYSTNLVWNDDLNFEGVAATVRYPDLRRFEPFVTLGYFPLRESSPPATSERSFAGAQTGFSAKITGDWAWRFGLAYYHFSRLEGRVENDFAELDTLGYGRYEYPASLRQRGNTLFRTNSITDASTTNLWGLASKFKVQNLTTSLDWGAFDPFHVVLTADVVRNSGFDRDEIFARTGHRIEDGSNRGYQVRLSAGNPIVRASRDWQVYFGYRKLGSDAVLDAFTDTDFGLGGTNSKGFFVGATVGLLYDATLSLRYLAARSIDSPTLRRDSSTGAIARDEFRADVLQLDLNARF